MRSARGRSRRLGLARTPDRELNPRTRPWRAAVGAARDIHVDISVDKPAGHESLNVVIPWSDRRFQFTSKQNTRPAHGAVRVGDRTWASATDATAWGSAGPRPRRLAVLQPVELGGHVGAAPTSRHARTAVRRQVDRRHRRHRERPVHRRSAHQDRRRARRGATTGTHPMRPWRVRTPGSESGRRRRSHPPSTATTRPTSRC